MTGEGFVQLEEMKPEGRREKFRKSVKIGGMRHMLLIKDELMVFIMYTGHSRCITDTRI